MKKIVLCLLAVCMLLQLTACGGGKEVDMDALAAELVASSAFTMDMSQYAPNPTAIAGTYGFDESEVVKSCMYVNTGTAEEIFLAQAADSKAADHLEELCAERIEAQSFWLKSYVPEALPRLDNAIVKRSGNFVLLVVADNADTAKSIVDKYLK